MKFFTATISLLSLFVPSLISAASIPTPLPSGIDYVYIDESTVNTTSPSLDRRQAVIVARVDTFFAGNCDEGTGGENVVIGSELIGNVVQFSVAQAVALISFDAIDCRVLGCFAGFSCFAPSPVLVLDLAICNLQAGLNFDKVFIQCGGF